MVTVIVRTGILPICAAIPGVSIDHGLIHVGYALCGRRVPSSTLIGRRTELATLADVIASAVIGQPRFVLVGDGQWLSRLSV